MTEDGIWANMTEKLRKSQDTLKKQVLHPAPLPSHQNSAAGFFSGCIIFMHRSCTWKASATMVLKVLEMFEQGSHYTWFCLVQEILWGPWLHSNSHIMQTRCTDNYHRHICKERERERDRGDAWTHRHFKILVISISALNQESDGADMNQIIQAGTGPAWKTKVDQ